MPALQSVYFPVTSCLPVHCTPWVRSAQLLSRLYAGTGELCHKSLLPTPASESYSCSHKLLSQISVRLSTVKTLVCSKTEEFATNNRDPQKYLHCIKNFSILWAAQKTSKPLPLVYRFFFLMKLFLMGKHRISNFLPFPWKLINLYLKSYNNRFGGESLFLDFYWVCSPHRFKRGGGYSPTSFLNWIKNSFIKPLWASP